MPIIDCPECLAQISDTAEFCPHCDHRFEPLPTPRRAVYMQPYMQPQKVYIKDTVMTRNRGCADLLIIAVLISVVVIVGGYVFLGSR